MIDIREHVKAKGDVVLTWNGGDWRNESRSDRFHGDAMMLGVNWSTKDGYIGFTINHGLRHGTPREYWIAWDPERQEWAIKLVDMEYGRITITTPDGTPLGIIDKNMKG